MNQEAQWTIEIVVDAPLKRVWKVAEDITLIPRYHPEVDKVDLIAGQAKRSLGTKYQCNILEGRRAGSCVEEVVACEPERMLATRMVSDTWGIDRMLTDFRVEATVSRRTETSTILKFQAFYEPVGLKSRTEALEIIKIVRTRQCGSLLDAELEGFPFEHTLYRLISVRTYFASRDQRPADLRVEIYFFVDRPAHLLEGLQMFALRFFEMQADESVMHLKDLICERRHSVERNRYKRGLTTFRLQLTEMPHVHSCRLTSHLQKSVLVNFSSPVRRNANASQRAEAIQAFENLSGLTKKSELTRRNHASHS
jgi:hypothetical protein